MLLRKLKLFLNNFSLRNTEILDKKERGVSRPQSDYEETVYFLPLSSQEFQVLI